MMARSKCSNQRPDILMQDRLLPARRNHLQRTAGPYILVKAGQSGGHCWSFFLRNRLIQYLQGCVIEIAKAIGLESIGDDCKQQVPRQMSRGLSPEDSLPASA